MNNLIKSFILILIFAIIGCKKDAPIASASSAPKCWEKFVGNYVVYDTANSNTYNMTITHKDSIQSGGGVLDSLIISNYGNRFDVRAGFVCQGYDPNVLFFSPPYPSYDHNGKRWSFSLNTNDTTTIKYENQLKNDTIILYFRLNNIAFYSPDGVPYYAADEKHIAVKQ